MIVARAQKVNSATQDFLRPVGDMETAADLGTRGGRVQHVRLGLAQRFGNVSLARFGELVAEEQTRLTGEPVAAYHASTVSRWESGADLYLMPAIAIASLGGVTAMWLGLGDGVQIERKPRQDQEARTKVIEPERIEKPTVTRRRRGDG